MSTLFGKITIRVQPIIRYDWHRGVRTNPVQLAIVTGANLGEQVDGFQARRTLVIYLSEIRTTLIKPSFLSSAFDKMATSNCGRVTIGLHFTGLRGVSSVVTETPHLEAHRIPMLGLFTLKNTAHA